MTSAILKRFSLRLRRRPLPPSPLPLGLDPDQAEAVAKLPSHPAGRAWAVALERLFDSQQEQLANRLAHDDYLFQCGVVHALRVVAALPDTFTTALEAQRARDTRHTRDTEPVRDWELNSGWFPRRDTPVARR